MVTAGAAAGAELAFAGARAAGADAVMQMNVSITGKNRTDDWLMPSPSPSPEPLETNATSDADRVLGPMAADSGASSLPCPEFAECQCCEKAKRSMMEYCEQQMPMGDLDLRNYDCRLAMGAEITMRESADGVRYTGYQSCEHHCDDLLSRLHAETCPMACQKIKLVQCPPCSPPPPPPAPPCEETKELGHFPPGYLRCYEVPKDCCEETLNRLQKFCFSYQPRGEAKKTPDKNHWDGGEWTIPSSFEALCDSYAPHECSCTECSLVMQAVARQTSSRMLCDAVMKCPNPICENQCPTDRALSGIPDTIIGLHRAAVAA